MAKKGGNMKYIAVQWRPEESMYGMAMRVVCSNHPRFVEGYRFDFGFMTIASREGYTIMVMPSKEIYQPDYSKTMVETAF